MQNAQLRIYLMFSALVVASASPAWADTVYKSTDANGNTSYSSQPPTSPAAKAKTVEMNIDPNRNVLPVAPAQPQAYPQSQSPSGTNTGQTAAGSVAEAEAALKAAEQAFAAGQVVQPGDFVGRVGGGVGPSQQRIERINELQNAVDQAKAALERARGGGD